MRLSHGGPVDFVLIDARGPKAYARSHVPGALNLPHREMTAERMAAWPDDTLFVVYCAGPHCNGADRAALRLAQLGRPVKLMLGGMTGWADEGFRLRARRRAGIAEGRVRCVNHVRSSLEKARDHCGLCAERARRSDLSSFLSTVLNPR